MSFNKGNRKFKENFKEGKDFRREDYVCPQCFDKYTSNENFINKGHCPKCGSILRPHFKSMKSFGGIKSMTEAIMKHGDKPDKTFDSKQLAMGVKVEKEHTDDPELAKQIAKAHLMEDPKYYTKLAEMEQGRTWGAEPDSSPKEAKALVPFLKNGKRVINKTYNTDAMFPKKREAAIGEKDMKVKSYGKQLRNESGPIDPATKEPLVSQRDEDFGQIWVSPTTGKKYYIGSDGYLYAKEFAKSNKSFLEDYESTVFPGIEGEDRDLLGKYQSEEAGGKGLVQKKIQYKRGGKTFQRKQWVKVNIGKQLKKPFGNMSQIPIKQGRTLLKQVMKKYNLGSKDAVVKAAQIVQKVKKSGDSVGTVMKKMQKHLKPEVSWRHKYKMTNNDEPKDEPKYEPFVADHLEGEIEQRNAILSDIKKARDTIKKGGLDKAEINEIKKGIETDTKWLKDSESRIKKWHQRGKAGIAENKAKLNKLKTMVNEQGRFSYDDIPKLVKTLDIDKLSSADPNTLSEIEGDLVFGYDHFIGYVKDRHSAEQDPEFTKADIRSIQKDENQYKKIFEKALKKHMKELEK